MLPENVFEGRRIWRWGPVKGWLLTINFVVEGILLHMEKECGVRWPDTTTLFRHGEVVWLQDWERMMDASVTAFDAALLPPVRREQLYAQYQEVVARLRVIADDVYHTGIAHLTDNELLDYYDSWATLIFRFWAVASPGEVSTFGGELKLQQWVDEHLDARDAVAAMEALTAPADLSFFQYADLDLVKRVVAFGDGQAVLQEHVNEFYWLDNGYGGARRRSVEDAHLALRRLVEENGSAPQALQHIREYKEGLWSRRQDAAQQFGIPQKVLDVSTALGFAISWQDHRKAEQFRGLDVLWCCLEQFEHRFGQERENLFWLRSQELREYIHDPKEVERMAADRRAGAAIVATNEAVEIWGGEQGRSLVDRFWNVSSGAAGEDDELRGVVASFGRQKEKVIRGVARVVMQAGAQVQFNDGEILVAPMTSPDYLPFMRRAKAIVTDEGGLTAHAAVVSRELGVPCVVGLKVATRRIHSGDNITIHLDTGGVDL